MTDKALLLIPELYCSHLWRVKDSSGAFSYAQRLVVVFWYKYL